MRAGARLTPTRRAKRYIWRPGADLKDMARGYMLNLSLWPPGQFVDAWLDVLSEDPDVRRLILGDSDAPKQYDWVDFNGAEFWRRTKSH